MIILLVDTWYDLFGFCQKGKIYRYLRCLSHASNPLGFVVWQNPNTKANQTQNSANQTQSTEVFIKKKKKIPNTQTKIKPSKPLTHGRSHRRRHRRSELVVVIVVRLVAPHRRSEIRERRSLCLCSGARRSPLSAPSDPPSRYFALFSLWLFLNLSLFNLYLTEIKMEMNRRSTS